jgi:N-acyl homoserine lactone hydrolase
MSPQKIYTYSVVCLAVNAAILAQGCVVTGHPTGDALWGRQASSSALEEVVERPGPIEVETVASATWQVPLEGMLNLEHPRARAAELTSSEQPIELYFHALRHPTRGLFIVDTGVSRAQKAEPERAALRGVVAKLAKLDTLRVKVDLKTWLERQHQPLAGVFFTHLHLDHVLGVPDVPAGTPLFTGPGEARAHGLLNLFTRPVTDRALQGQAALGQWQFRADPERRFVGVLDVFEDGSLWALHVPGHTPGSTAYLARTPQGPVLIVGDASHTAWGWDHEVEPGSFSSDVEQSAASLAALKGLVKRHPSIEVRLGHQPRGQALVAAAEPR